MVFSVNQKGEIFICGKSIDESSFGFILLALYNINSYHFDAWTTKPAMTKECNHASSPFFGLTNKATWPKSLMSGAKINCHVCLWICSLPVSVVTARIGHQWLCIIFTLLDHPLMTGLSIFQIDPSTFLFQVLIRISLQNLLTQLERVPYLPSLKVTPCGTKFLWVLQFFQWSAKISSLKSK